MDHLRNLTKGKLDQLFELFLFKGDVQEVIDDREVAPVKEFYNEASVLKYKQEVDDSTEAPAPTHIHPETNISEPCVDDQGDVPMVSNVEAIDESEEPVVNEICDEDPPVEKETEREESLAEEENVGQVSMVEKAPEEDEELVSDEQTAELIEEEEKEAEQIEDDNEQKIDEVEIEENEDFAPDEADNVEENKVTDEEKEVEEKEIEPAEAVLCGESG